MSTELRIKTEMPSQHRMNRLITICEKAACDESAEYVLAATLTGAADEAGITPDGDDFEARRNQRKVFMGRVIEIIRERELVSRQPALDAEGEWRVGSNDPSTVMRDHDYIALATSRKHAAQIVRDHSAVPKLVKALTSERGHVEALLTEHKDHVRQVQSVPCSADWCRMCEFLTSRLRTIDAALTSAQIQDPPRNEGK